MLLQEAGYNIGSKCEADTSIVLAPSGDILIGIRPQKITEKTAVRNLSLLIQRRTIVSMRVGTYISWTHDTSDLFHGVQVRAQATVHCENLFVNNGSNRQAIEAVGEGFPELDVISPLALIVETIDTVDGCAFMVAAKHEEVLRVLDLVCKKQADGFERLLASVYIIAEEEVVRLGGEAAIFKQTEKIVVLTVYIATDLNRLVSSYHDFRHVRAHRLELRTFIGASSSSRIGCEMKISRALVQRNRISVSRSWTCLPGLLPRTSSSLSMIESKSTSFSAIAGACYWLWLGCV